MVSPPFQNQPCLLHPDREAAARCPGCGQSFCRECVTEHDLRMLCAACLEAETSKREATPRKRARLPTGLFEIAVGLLILWFTAYTAGRLLLSVPTPFHEGTAWEGE